jgi:methionyl-tRNA formyltransferase
VRILFMGTAELACPCLEAVAGQVIGVITQPDRPKGRSLQLAPTPVKVTAGKLGLPVSQPEKIRNVVDEIRAARPDLIVVVAYGQILPKSILEIPPRGCINVHASLLPRWRGASPIQHAILHGDRETGVTTMFINEKMDAGDIILQRAEPIRPDDTAGTLYDRLATIGAQLLSETLAGTMARRPQDESQVTHARKLTKEDGRVDWTKPAIEIERQIRAMNPWPGAFAYLGDLMVKFSKAEVVNGELRLLEVQPANGKRMSFEAFRRGHPEVLARAWR